MWTKPVLHLKYVKEMVSCKFGCSATTLYLEPAIHFSAMEISKMINWGLHTWSGEDLQGRSSWLWCSVQPLLFWQRDLFIFADSALCLFREVCCTFLKELWFWISAQVSFAAPKDFWLVWTPQCKPKAPSLLSLFSADSFIIIFSLNIPAAHHSCDIDHSCLK